MLGGINFLSYLCKRIFAVYDCEKVLKRLINTFKLFKIMNKTGLVEAVAAKAGVSKAEALKVIEAAIDVTAETLKSGENVQLIGVATLSVVEKAARKGINPATKQVIEIPARKAIKFKAGAKLAL